MTALVDPISPTYITPAALKARSLFAFPANLSNEDLEKLIRMAEGQIDRYVGPQPHHPDDDNEHRVFPRSEDENDDGDVIIPPEVTEATQYQVEWLYEQWFSVTPGQTVPTEHAVISQNVTPDGSYNETRANKGLNYADATLCEQAKAALTRVKSSSAQMRYGAGYSDSIPESSRENYIIR